VSMVSPSLSMTTTRGSALDSAMSEFRKGDESTEAG
jgi:hypothetical protein